MTTPDQSPPEAPPRRSGDARSGAWAAVGRLLGVQLLVVLAVTAVITAIYGLAGPSNDNHENAGGTAVSSPASTPSQGTTPATSPPANPAPSPSVSAPTPTTSTSTEPSATAGRLKVDVLNQSAPGGAAAKTAERVRQGGWRIGRVDDFRGNVSTTTIYYPTGEAQAARELAAVLPGKLRTLPRFSTIAEHRLTVILTR